ncbi:MAG TPA: PepSY domain-containing protein [Hyphomicrobium sp.]|nr:PepSY domain-containing protein [Hyphomicrobium sp.]
MMRRFGITLIAILAGASAVVGYARADDDDEERQQIQIMRGAVERGEAKPLAEILDIARRARPGEVVGVEFETKGKSWIYEVKIADKTGHLVELHVNAVNGQILKIEEK